MVDGVAALHYSCGVRDWIGRVVVVMVCGWGSACGTVRTAPDDAAIDAGVDAAIDASMPRKRVFVTSQVYNGNLGGLAGGDAKCQLLAATARLSGVYKAWLSNATVSVASRLEHADVPYVLISGTVVANNWTGLTSGTLLHPIDTTEIGTRSLGGTSADCFFGGTGRFVWTNSNELGELASSNQVYSCGNDWNSAGPTGSSGPFGVVGNLARTDGMWTAACSSARCETTAPLYCFEQ